MDKIQEEIEQNMDFLKENLINWYPFEQNSNMLEISKNCNQITKYLNKISNKVVTIQDINQVEISKEEKFDYIIIHNLEQIEETLEEILNFVKDYKKENGTILIAIRNKLSLQSLNCTNIKAEEERNLYTKKEIEKILNKDETKCYKFYYILPNEIIPNAIFTDKYLPNSESILRALTIYPENTFVKQDEREIYRKILKENEELFKTFSNAFLIEISSKAKENDIKYVSFGNSRKSKYRLKTIMKEDVVIKEGTTEESQEHIQEIRNNIDILKKCNINILDKYENQHIFSTIVKNQKSFDEQLIEIAKRKGMEAVAEQIERFKNELVQKMEISNSTDNTVFDKYGINCGEEEKQKLHFVKDGVFDLIFQNCFLIENEFYFYDQEWKEENIPLEFILYRAIYYLGNSNKNIDVDFLYRAFGINEFISTFEELENILQKNIKDEDVWNLHVQSQKTTKSIYETMIHYRNLQAQLQNRINEIEAEKQKTINEKDGEIQALKQQIYYIEHSKSWKVTKPLRKIMLKLNKK